MPKSQSVFLDTNIFLRHLRNDHPEWSPACLQLFREIEAGKVSAWTTDLAIAEIVFILEGKRQYNQPREAIVEALLPILSLPHLKLRNKARHRRTFALYTAYPKLSYIDCYHAAQVEAEKTELYSYDTGFDALGTITRQTPPTKA